MRSLREAYRSFRRAPGVWTGIVLSLALGTGANIALFSIINGLMLRPLPVLDPDGLAVVRTVTGGEAWSYPVWQELQSARAPSEATRDQQTASRQPPAATSSPRAY